MTTRILRLSLVMLALTGFSLQLAGQPAVPKLKEEMRLPWSRGDERFIRHWLVLSDLPLAGGFDKDWLAAQGGEGFRVLSEANNSPTLASTSR